MNTFRLYLACGLVALATSQARAQSRVPALPPTAQSEVETLTPGQTSEHALKDDEHHKYAVRLDADQFLHVIVDQRGIDVVVTLYGLNAEQLIMVDSPNGSYGFESLSWIAASGGQYILEVRSAEKDSPPGRYTLNAEVRGAFPKDKHSLEADKLFAAGQQMAQDGKPESIRAALEKYQAALSLWRDAGEQTKTALTLETIASGYEALDDSPKALDLYKQALTAYQVSGDRAGQVMVIKDLARLYSALDENRKTLEYLIQALPLLRAIGDRKSEAATLNYIGRGYDDLGEKQKALDHLNQALSLRRALGDRRGEAVALNNIGLVYISVGEYQKALDYLNEALPLRRAVGDRSGEGTTLNNIGEVYLEWGEHQKALEYYNQALPIRRAVGDRSGEASTLNNIASVYLALGEPPKALEIFNQALAISRALGERASEANQLSNIGAVYDDLGEKQKALEYYNRALPLRRAVGDRSGEAVTLTSIGKVYRSLGENKKALEYYNQALPLSRAVGDRSSQATTLNNIGAAYLALGELPRAIEYFNQSLPLSRAIGDRSNEAVTLNNIGVAYGDLGEKQKALDYYNQALPLRRALGDRSGEAAALNNIGKLYSETGEKEKAMAYYDQSLPLCRAVGEHYGEAVTLRNMMLNARDRKLPSLAIFYGKRAINVYQQLRANISGLDKGLQQSFLHLNEAAYRTLADILISTGRLAEAQQVLGMLKEEEYFEFVRRDSTSSPVTERAVLTPEELALEEQYRKLADDLTRLGSERGELFRKAKRTPEEDRQLAKLDEQLSVSVDHFNKFLEKLQLALGTNSAKSARVVEMQDALGMKKTLRDLGPNVVLLYTLVGDDKYWVMLVTPDAEQAYENPIKLKDLQRKVFDFREALEDPRVDPAPLARQLYDILIGPKLSHDLKQGGAKTLMWSLDGVLRYLPVAALQDESGKYLVENYANVIFTPASRDRLKDPVLKHWKGLGMGVSKARAGFRELPGVPQELRAIIRDQSSPAGGTEGLLEGKVMLDESFTKDAMKAALRQNYQLVHIASHFRFQPGDETASFLLLGDVDDHNNRLTLGEIRKLSFEGINLLTLSACETAMSDTKANGIEVESFGVLAQRQGAEAVLATLWRVADVTTPKLMREFYEQREANQGLSKADALRRAQLSLLESKTRFSHPYFWAPFILIGNWK
jgi:CHAT domain-containing protein/Tfp pilus assembly protein PilF